MVERAVCSSSEETSATRSNDSTIEQGVIRRNDDFVSTRTTRRSNKKYINNRDIEESKVIGSSRLEATSEDTGNNTTFSTNSGRFSLFGWFKRGSRDSSSFSDQQRQRRERRPSSTIVRNRGSSDNEAERENVIETSSSDDECSETLYGTSTVRSFAFRTGTSRTNETRVNDTLDNFALSQKCHFSETKAPTTQTNPNETKQNQTTSTRSVGPFGPGASRILVGSNDEAIRDDVTKTLPAGISSRKRDITVRYSLQTCNPSSGSFGSCGNFSDNLDRTVLTDTRRSVARKCLHVRGKRRAPDPPTEQATRTRKNDEEREELRRGRKCVRGKRRQAPKPPDTSSEKSRISASLKTSKRAESSSCFSSEKETVSADSRANERIVSVASRSKEDTENADLRVKEETRSWLFTDKRESVSANLQTKEVTESFSAKGKTVSSDLAKEDKQSGAVTEKSENGSTSLSTKEVTGSSNLLKKDETVSAAIASKRETVSANLSTKHVTESPNLRKKEDIARVAVTDKREAVSVNFRTKGQAGSPNLSTKEVTVSADSRAKRETRSPNLLNKEEAVSASFPKVEELESVYSKQKGKTVSANLPKKEETEISVSTDKRQIRSAYLLTKEVTVSANLRVQGENSSLNLPKKEEIGDAILSVKEETKSANDSTVSAKVTSGHLSLPLQEEFASASTRSQEKAVSVDLPVNQRFPSPKVMNIGDANIVKKALEKFDNDEKSVKTENSRFPRSSRENNNAIKLIPGNSSAKNIAEETTSLNNPAIISNDSLVLQDGFLHSKREKNTYTTSATTSNDSNVQTSVTRSKGRISITTGSQTSTPAMPRPWYKRNVFEHSRDTGTSRRGDILRNPVQTSGVRDDVTSDQVVNVTGKKNLQTEKNQDIGTISRLNFFHKNEKSTDERKKEAKRKSGISILTNISELDKEAAAIVQEEQERNRAASVFLQSSRSHDVDKNRLEEDVIHEIVNSTLETSPRRGTRALISKFNAIGNITRVTVNTSFFAKNSSSTESRMEKSDITKITRENEDKMKITKNENTQGHRDLTRYFLSSQKAVKCDKTSDEIAENSGQAGGKNFNDNVSARLSFFRDITEVRKFDMDNATKVSENSKKIAENSTKIFRKNHDTRNFEKSPKFTRLRDDISCVEIPARKSKNDFHEGTRGKIVENEDNEKMDEKKCKIMEKEFSNGREDEKSLTKENCEKNVKISDSSRSNEISRVLDILVEAEKNDRRRTNLFSRSMDNETETVFDKENKGKLEISKDRGNFENPMKTDLREMLKEMKHSLPKRPKNKKIAERQSVTENHETGEIRDFVSSTNNEKSAHLNVVTVSYPPPVRIGGIFEKMKFPLTMDDAAGNYDRQKVSSAAQTSGNLRRLTSETETSCGGKFSKWRDEDIVYRTSGRGIAKPGTSGLTKNTFQLIRPREFARIEAIKTMKNISAENTYVNVEKLQSVYANDSIEGVKKNLPECSRNRETRGLFEEEKKFDHGDEIFEMETTARDSRISEPQNMNTLAVNRLLRKLEAAIASGHHQQAAGLAKELARLKIHCSVVRQRTKAKDVVNVNMYIEDKLAHQGPIPLRLARSMTVAQLKAKVFTEFEIPTNVQRWIVGKNLADDDTTRLEELQAVEGSPVFLYLVAPELKIEETPLRDEKVPLAEKETPKDPKPEAIDEISKLVELDEPEELTVESQTIKEEEEEEEEECISDELRMERYEALISLENCDVIPNSEPIDCPICFVTYGPQEGVILRDCLHMFCRPCIANTIRYCEEAEVECPFRDTEYTCQSTLQEREIKALVEPEVYQQHLAKSIAQAENNAGNNAFHCKTPDCPGWCIYDDNVNNFLCPVCGVNNCLTCQVVHTGKNCRQYQEELRLSKETDQESKRTAAMLEEMVDRGEALPCPTCAVVLMKKWGCDWLRCSMCKTEICWVTRGPRWGPGGKGDTSGGCRCGEKGVKCHPRCNYCH